LMWREKGCSCMKWVDRTGDGLMGRADVFVQVEGGGRGRNPTRLFLCRGAPIPDRGPAEVEPVAMPSTAVGLGVKNVGHFARGGGRTFPAGVFLNDDFHSSCHQKKVC